MSSSSSVTCVKYKRKREKKAAESHWGNLYCSTPFLSATLWLCRNPTLTHSTRSITPAAQTSSTGSNARDTGMFTGGLSVFITSLDTTFVVVFFAPKADSRLVSFCRGHSKPFELICCEIRRVICLKYNYSKRWESRDFRRGSFSRNARRFTFYLSLLYFYTLSFQNTVVRYKHGSGQNALEQEMPLKFSWYRLSEFLCTVDC